MPEYEKDFVLRQTKMLAKGLGAFLSKESVDEIMATEESQAADDKDKSEKPSSTQKKTTSD